MILGGLFLLLAGGLLVARQPANRRVAALAVLLVAIVILVANLACLEDHVAVDFLALPQGTPGVVVR